MDVLQQILASPQTYLLVLFGVAFRAIVWRRIQNEIDERFAKRLEDHKQELAVHTEAAKFEMQRNLADFGLYATKKHEASLKVWEALRRAHGSVSGVLGFSVKPTMEEYNEEDLLAYFGALHMPKGQQETILKEWRADVQGALSRAQPYLRMLEIQAADRVLSEARNLIYLNELYFPDSIIAVIDELVGELNEWMVNVQHPRTEGEPRWLPDRKRLRAKLEAVHSALRDHVSAGTKPMFAGVGAAPESPPGAS